MKFIADAMLVGLAKKLRLLGYDTEIVSTPIRGRWWEKAGDPHRVLLTRRAQLLRDESLNCYTVKTEGAWEQLAEVVEAFSLKVKKGLFSRCNICNREVVSIKKSDVLNKVPPGIYERHSEFWRCPDCGRIYWPGGHWDRFKRRLQLALRK